MTMNNISKVMLATLLMLSSSSLVSAQETSSTPTAGCPSVLPNTEIDITADLSEFRQTEKLVLLQGSVDVHQGPLRVRADAIKLSYEPNEEEIENPEYDGVVTTLVATGAVRIDCNGERASGETAYYNVLKRTIDLTGKVMLAREGNILTGDRLKIDLNSGSSRIYGGKAIAGQDGQGRVHAIFKTGSDEDKD